MLTQFNGVSFVTYKIAIFDQVHIDSIMFLDQIGTPRIKFCFFNQTLMDVWSIDFILEDKYFFHIHELFYTSVGLNY